MNELDWVGLKKNYENSTEVKQLNFILSELQIPIKRLFFLGYKKIALFA